MPLQKGSSKIAYLAGLFDGEGSICASPSPKCRTNFRVKIGIVMCDREPLDFAVDVFGGHVTELARKTKTGKSIFAWELHCQKAADVLESLLPFLLVKADRARNAIALARSMLPRGTAKMAVLSFEQIQRRTDLAFLIKSANCASNGRIRNLVCL